MNDVVDQTSLEEIPESKRKRRPTNRPFPPSTFEEALNLCQSIMNFGGGQPVLRLSFFNEIGKSPESSSSRTALSNANKYGLINGSYSAERLELTPDAKICLGENSSVDEIINRKLKLSILSIHPFAHVYGKIAGNKLPSPSALSDMMKEAGVPDDYAKEAVDTFIVNLRASDALQLLSGSERVLKEDVILELARAKRPEIVKADPKNTTLEPPSSTAVVTSTAADFERTCFYITPIGEDGSEQRKHSDLLLGSIVEPAIEVFGLKVVRADKIESPGIITRQIIDYVLKSRLVIADLSFHNPNVFYELALRHATRKPIVQIIRKFDRIPFDINQMRTIVIDTTDIYSLVPRISVYQSEIASHTRSCLDSPENSDTPLSIYYPNLQTTY